MAWAKFNINGVDYDLSHLNDMLVRVKSRSGGAKVFRARVTFGCHSFTKDTSPNDDPAHHYQDGGTVRCFCPVRHGHSVMLPGLFRDRAEGGGDTYFGSNNNMLVLDNGHGPEGPYIAAYGIKRSNRPDVDVIIQVRSAYMKPNLAKVMSVLPFYSVVAATARAQPIVRPAPRRVL